MKIQLFILTILILAGCSQKPEGNDIPILISEEYEQSGLQIVDLAIQDRPSGSSIFCRIFFVTNTPIPPSSVATLYDKNDRILRKMEIGTSRATSSFYIFDNPSYQYLLSPHYLDCRLIHKIIISRQ
jgi:hypothetical protein